MLLHLKILGLLSVAIILTLPLQAERPNLILILADDLGFSDLGCYGGEIATPNLDALANGGLRLTQMYNTSRCCSTRASLLTGVHAHRAGVGAMSADNGIPGYRGFLAEDCVTIAEVLQQSGYRTYLSGKWHLRGKGNPDCLPTNRGFDEFFGHFRAYASFWRPDLYVRLPEDVATTESEKGFYATSAITDRAIGFIEEARSEESPYFLYLAYNAPHFPLHAPVEKIEKYMELYQQGWDRIREERFRRLNQLGILHGVTELSPRGEVPKVPERNRDSDYYGETIPKWTDLSVERRTDLARRMAIYAAMVEIMDENIGRVVDHLAGHGELKNTLIVFLSDNGACAEWDPLGFDNEPYPVNRLHTGEDLERMGQPGSFHSYGTGWANVCNTPFRLYKHYNHEGGISTPCIVHGFTDRLGEIDRQPAHITDLSATFLDIAGVRYPTRNRDKPVPPSAGISLTPLLEGHTLPERPLFFEHEGNRAVRLGQWKLVWTNFRKAWELYDMANDRIECHDLADQYPAKVEQLNDLWHQWAQQNQVQPEKVPQPSGGMPKIYYLPAQESVAAQQLREMGGHAFLDLRSNRIREVNLNRNRMVNDATMELVRVCEQITDLSLEGTDVGDFGIRRLANLKKLEWLNLFQTAVTDRALATLSQFPDLQHLPIGETGVTDTGMAEICRMKKLQYLGLRGNKITDRGLQGIEVLQNLTALQLGATGVSDAGLASVKRLSKLKKLWLHDTTVTGGAVADLGRNLPNLQELYLQRTHLTIDEVRHMRIELPGCRIFYESDE